MKQLYRLLLIICVFVVGYNTAKAQLIPIPDAGFRAYLQNAGFSGCLTGSLLDTSCPLVVNATKINASGYSIGDLEGVQYFTNLDSLIVSGGMLTSLPTLPNSIHHLAITYSNLQSIAEFPPYLTYLNLSNNQLISVPSFPNSLYTIDVSNNNLASIPALPSSLTNLYASDNSLTEIPTLPSGVIELYVNYNDLGQLPDLPNGLSTLACNYNYLESLPVLSPSLVTLECTNNELTSLPTSFSQHTNLRYVKCAYNQIDSLTAFPLNLWDFYANHNLFTQLPEPPASTRNLIVNNNFLDSLPNISNCNLLFTLNCSSNQSIQHLPNTLPAGLKYLYCSNCSLDSLPAIPPQLIGLRCSSNFLQELPLLPYTLIVLNCSNNNLSSLPPLSNSSYFNELLLNNNPNLYCLPPFERFTGTSSFFNISNTGISCLPNYFSHPTSLNYIDDLPLCGIFGNPAGCEIAWNVAGRAHLESSGNCVQNQSEPNLMNVKMQLVQGGVPTQQVYVNTSGFYSFNTELDEYEVKIDTTGLPFDVVCPVTNSYITNPGGTDTLDFMGNFAAQCRNGYDLAAISLVHYNGLFFPTNSAQMSLKVMDLANYYGVTCNTDGLGGHIKIWIDGPASFGTYQSGGILNADTLDFYVDDFSTITNFTRFYYTVVTDTFPPMGSTVCMSVKVEPDGVNLDVNPSNNELSMCYEVINSYDPNYKEVYPSHVSQSGLWHTYTAHFQNTGTAAAQNILLKDTLSSNLDWSTFTRLDASHNNYTQVLENGIVHFYFPEIFLPDSTTDEPNSHGWVQFKIKTKSSLNSYTVIPNTVSIYFDYNDPVVTNSADLTLCFPEYAVQSLTICPHDSVKVGNDWYTAAGNYSNLLNTIHGCDSLVATSLNHFPTIFNEQAYSLCYGSSIDLNGITYSETGSYQSFYITSAGCDSIVTVNIQVDPLISGSQTISICQGDSIVSGGVVYKEPTTFVMNFISHGCDSLVTTTLLVNDVDLSVQTSDINLIASPSMQSYAWIDCATNSIIPGANNPVFTPLNSGNYAVQVLSPEGCEARSDCYYVHVVGIAQVEQLYWTVRPNPAKELVYINLHNKMIEGIAVLVDVTGRKVSEMPLQGEQTVVPIDQIANGTYLIQIYSKGNLLASKRLVVAN